MTEKYQSKTAEQGFSRRPNRGAPVEKPKEGKQTFRRLLQYFRAEQRYVLLLGAVVLTGVTASVAAPGFQSRAIDAIASGNHDSLPKLLGFMLAGYLIYGITSLGQGYLSASLSQKVIRRIRNDLFVHITSLPVSAVDRHSHGDLMSRMTNDAENISNVISESLSSMFSGILTLIGTVGMMLWFSVPLTLLTCSTVVLTVFVTQFITKKMRIWFTKRQTLLGRLNGTIEEMITCSKTVTAYNMQDRASEDFRATADELTHAGIIADIISSSMGPLMNMLNNVHHMVYIFLYLLYYYQVLV